MAADVIKKVECLTCHTDHLYRRPKSERDAAKAAVSTKRAASGTARPRSASARETAALKLERSNTASWEKAIAGQPTGAFKPFTMTTSYGEGQLVHHSKFGDGVVARIIDRGKVEVLFKDGPRIMAHGQG